MSYTIEMMATTVSMSTYSTTHPGLDTDQESLLNTITSHTDSSSDKTHSTPSSATDHDFHSAIPTNISWEEYNL